MRSQALSVSAPETGALRCLVVITVYVLVFAVAVPFQVWALGARLDALLRLPTIEILRTPGRVLFAGGAALWLWAHVCLSVAGRGLPISRLPPARLVASGPYAFFRHPIYVGFTLGAAGLGCSVGSLGHGILAPLLLGSACWAYVVSFEGPALQRRFGEAYHRVGRVTVAGRFRSSGPGQLRTALERIANRTVLFRVGHTLWVTYGLFVALGSFVVALLARVTLGGLCSPQEYVGLSIGLALAMALGARVASLAYNWAALRRRGVSELRVVGFVSWGAYLGLLVFTGAFGAATRIPPLAIVDRLLPLFFLCMALGRVGCLTYGCCFGRPSPGGIRWTDPDSKVVRLLGAEVGSLPRAPVQLLGAGVGLLAAGLTFLLDLRNGAVGTTTLFGFLWYFLARLGVEQLRDERRLGRLQWTRGQWFAAGGAGTSLVLLTRLDSGMALNVAQGSLDWLAMGTAIAVGGLVFVICGFHWRQVGRW